MEALRHHAEGWDFILKAASLEAEDRHDSLVQSVIFIKCLQYARYPTWPCGESREQGRNHPAIPGGNLSSSSGTSHERKFTTNELALVESEVTEQTRICQKW